MIPIILVSTDDKKTQEFINKYKEENQISPSYIYEIFPEGKEISIEQIRNIKKDTIYKNTEPQLFILHNFNTSSYEAQNAFLKTLEEHLDNLHFLLIVSSYRDLAPTIVSRSKIIVLNSIQKEYDSTFGKKMDSFIDDSSLKILSDNDFQAKKYEDPLEIFDKFIAYFRRRTVSDKKAPQILREILRLRSLVQKNNVDSQNATDHLLITLLNTYRQA